MGSQPQSPARNDAAGDDENGRRLLLVQALSTRWNWYVPHHLGGKIVWAQIGEGHSPVSTRECGVR